MKVGEILKMESTELLVFIFSIYGHIQIESGKCCISKNGHFEQNGKYINKKEFFVDKNFRSHEFSNLRSMEMTR